MPVSLVEGTESTCPGRTESFRVLSPLSLRLVHLAVSSSSVVQVCQVPSLGAIESLDPAVGAAANLDVEVIGTARFR